MLIPETIPLRGALTSQPPRALFLRVISGLFVLHLLACSGGTDPEEGSLFGSVVVFGSLTDSDASPVAGATVTMEVFHGPCGVAETPEVTEAGSTDQTGYFREQLVSLQPDLIACIGITASAVIKDASRSVSVELEGVQLKGEDPDSLQVDLSFSETG
jgi:hypothetical protein